MLTIQTLKLHLWCEFKHPGASDQQPITVPSFVCSCFLAVVKLFFLFSSNEEGKGFIIPDVAKVVLHVVQI